MQRFLCYLCLGGEDPALQRKEEGGNGWGKEGEEMDMWLSDT